MPAAPTTHPPTVVNPVGRLAAEHPSVVKIGRAGWFAKGAVYLVAGALALLIFVRATGWSDAVASSPEQEASPTGAIETVAGSAGGTLLLLLLAAGMVLYAAWRVTTAFLPGGTDAKAWVHRIGYLVSAVLYTTLALSAIRLATNDAASTDGNRQVTSLSARMMESGAGRFAVGLVGLIIVGAGLYRVAKGARQDVADELDLSGMSAERVRWTRRLGVVGEIGRGVGIGLVGFFLVRAAVTYDPAEATGLDGALRRLATEPWGLVVVATVGIGFVAYGVFCLTTFTHRRLEAP